MKAKEFLARLLGGDERVLVLDGECVDHVGLYEDVLAQLAALAGLKLASFSGVDGARRSVTMTFVGSTTVTTFEAEGGTDWLDSSAVVTAFNRALDARNDSRRLIEFHSEEFGQLSGWALLTSGQLSEFMLFGIENGQMSLTLPDGFRLPPASEDRGGSPDEWEARFS